MLYQDKSGSPVMETKLSKVRDWGKILAGKMSQRLTCCQRSHSNGNQGVLCRKFFFGNRKKNLFGADYGSKSTQVQN
jgi:hypothetical protein